MVRSPICSDLKSYMVLWFYNLFNLNSFQPLFSLLNLEFHFLIGDKFFVGMNKPCSVNKKIFTILLSNETISFGFVVPFYFSMWHGLSD